MGSAHVVFTPPGIDTPQQSIQRSLAGASGVQLLDQLVRHSSVPKATSPLGAVHGLGPCRFRPPWVWYAPGINPPISCLRFGCPTSGPTILFRHVTPRPVTLPPCGGAGGTPRPRATILRVFILVLGHHGGCLWGVLPKGGGPGGLVGWGGVQVGPIGGYMPPNPSVGPS